jgi:hypothetical protein
MEKSTITTVRGMTPGTAAQMQSNQIRLFRPELSVQIFPKAEEDLFTFHSLYPGRNPSMPDTCEKNSRTAPAVPVRGEPFGRRPFPEGMR